MADYNSHLRVLSFNLKEKQIEILDNLQKGKKEMEFYPLKRRSLLGWAEFWWFGVIANSDFKKGDFLLEYVGERINGDEAKIREEEGDCYIFGYKYNDKFQW
ncbi:Hypothetical predicted protein [Mytilus galloprovincialis]|uniref:SET domain-containing protein n=1 Tax=Mytilus galloprovincialis TaxID=29158 RepID=A0A8B6C2S5_MYTGA|nr:Hypothetical predicted protein [Mytilus galloprovincialis]